MSCGKLSEYQTKENILSISQKIINKFRYIIMRIDNKFEIEDVVFLITDDDQHQRIVTGIQISKNGLLYRLAKGTTDSWHYDYEIATDKNYNI